jgi:4-amino-4-deoxy-L-arabinose transferase-like glycosyltransferase
MKLFLSHVHLFILTAVIILASFLRLYQLSSIPVGIHGDEASIGWNALSLMTTGYSETGQYLPLAVDQFGDFRPAGYHYLDIPFVALLGVNELATRLPSALFGIASVYIIFLLVQYLYANKTAGLFAAIMLAISPWHVNLSRATSEGIIAAFFVLLGTYLFIKGIRTKKSLLVMFSAIPFILSFLFYHSARIFVPMIVLFSLPFLLHQQRLTKKQLFIGIAVICTIIGALGIIYVKSAGNARPLAVSIFSAPLAQRDISQQIGEDGTAHPIITRFYHNKLLFYGRLFLQNYFPHYTGTFWFLENGLPIRYRVPWTGNLYLIDGALFLLGFSLLSYAVIKKKNFLLFFPLLWLCLAGIPAGLTLEDIPNIQRSSFILYGFILIASYGFIQITSKKQYKIYAARTFYAVCITISFFHFGHNYFHHMRTSEPWHRSAAAKEVASVVQELKKTYSTIVMTTEGGNNLIHYLFYTSFSPVTYKALNFPREEEQLRFDGITLTSKHCPIDGTPTICAKSEPGKVYITKTECKYPKNAVIRRVINHPDGTPAYNIVTVDPLIDPLTKTNCP